MACPIEVLFSPAEFRTLRESDLAHTVCVVVDVLRATSTFVTALANGAQGIIPVAEISEALGLRRERPDVLLAGEREGVRISAAVSGGVDFDLGNSPREFTSARVAGKTIVSTTTNGTRALRACAGAERIFIGSFLNLSVTAGAITQVQTQFVRIVCAGTGEGIALEDILAAGALVNLLAAKPGGFDFKDSAEMARRLFLAARSDLRDAVCSATNAQRLLTYAGLQADVDFCIQVDRLRLVAASDESGTLRKLPEMTS